MVQNVHFRQFHSGQQVNVAKFLAQNARRIHVKSVTQFVGPDGFQFALQHHGRMLETGGLVYRVFYYVGSELITTNEIIVSVKRIIVIICLYMI